MGVVGRLVNIALAMDYYDFEEALSFNSMHKSE